MAQDPKHELFGELRSMLAQPDKDEQWAEALFALLSRAQQTLGQEYEASWLPHLHSAQDALPQPLYTVTSLEALERVCNLAPCARFALKLEHIEDEAESIAQCPHLSQVIHLDLSGNNMEFLHAYNLAQSPYLSQLTHLDLSDNHMEDEGAKLIIDCPHLSQLTHLNLADNNIYTRGAWYISSSQELYQLRHLDLSNNHLGKEGAQHLLRGSNLKKLEHLNLQNNEIEDDGDWELHAPVERPHLMHLDLSYNQIEESGFQAIAQSPYLSQLTPRP